MEINKESLKELFKEIIVENLPKENKLTLTIEECVNYTGIGRNKLMELAHSFDSEFPVFKVGNKFLVNKDMLDTWLEKITIEKRTL